MSRKHVLNSCTVFRKRSVMGAGRVLIFVIIGGFLFGQCVSVSAESVSSHKNDWFSPCNDGSAVRFATGFEGTSEVRSSVNGTHGIFEGAAGPQPCSVHGLPISGSSSARFGRAIVEFEGGSGDERGAEVVDAPDERASRALRFWLAKPNVLGVGGRPVKGRVQMDVYGNKGVRELAMSVRMYLHPDFNIVRSFPGTIDWLTISEWWNNASWTGEKFPFRISVNIVKEAPGPNGLMFFQVQAQKLDGVRSQWESPVWSEINRTFAIPVGRWVTLEYGFVEGSADSGRFVLAATISGGGRTVIFDVNNYTHHPDDLRPAGLSHFNPMKLYTSSRLIEFVRAFGGTMEIMWDDFELAACSGCATRLVLNAHAIR